MYKLDFENWVPFKGGDKLKPTKNRFRINLSEPGHVVAVKGKKKYVVGYGVSFTIEGRCDYVVASSGGSAETCKHCAIDGLKEAPFTNINKIPGQSVEERAVTLALRVMRAEQRKNAVEAERESRRMLIEAGHMEEDEEEAVNTDDEDERDEESEEEEEEEEEGDE